MKKITEESFIERSVKLHCDKYDYNLVNYIAARTKVTIICKDCRTDFEITPEAHIAGQGCRACGYKRNGLAKRANLDEFVRTSSEVHGNKFDYKNVEWRGNKAEIELFCPVHEEFFTTIPRNHMAGADCPKCAKIRGGIKGRGNTENFVAQVKEKYGDKFDCSEVNYVKSNEKVKVRCTLHDHWWHVTPNSLLMNGGNCPMCNSEAIGNRNRITTEEFVAESRNRKGDLYGYERVNYVDTNTKVEIYCNDHGYFWQNPGYHLQGGGCPHCHNHGYKSYQPGELYILTDGVLTKVGITNKGAASRCKYISKDSNRSFEVLKSYGFEDGRIPQNVETEALRFLNSKYKMSVERFSGSTESFYDVNQAELLNKIDKLIQEYADTQ